jgi:hypothetical protein
MEYEIVGIQVIALSLTSRTRSLPKTAMRTSSTACVIALALVVTAADVTDADSSTNTKKSEACRYTWYDLDGTAEASRAEGAARARSYESLFQANGC